MLVDLISSRYCQELTRVKRIIHGLVWGWGGGLASTGRSFLGRIFITRLTVVPASQKKMFLAFMYIVLGERKCIIHLELFVVSGYCCPVRYVCCGWSSLMITGPLIWACRCCFYEKAAFILIWNRKTQFSSCIPRRVWFLVRDAEDRRLSTRQQTLISFLSLVSIVPLNLLNQGDIKNQQTSSSRKRTRRKQKGVTLVMTFARHGLYVTSWGEE